MKVACCAQNTQDADARPPPPVFGGFGHRSVERVGGLGHRVVEGNAHGRVQWSFDELVEVADRPPERVPAGGRLSRGLVVGEALTLGVDDPSSKSPMMSSVVSMVSSAGQPDHTSPPGVSSTVVLGRAGSLSVKVSRTGRR